MTFSATISAFSYFICTELKFLVSLNDLIYIFSIKIPGFKTNATASILTNSMPLSRKPQKTKENKFNPDNEEKDEESIIFNSRNCTWISHISFMHQNYAFQVRILYLLIFCIFHPPWFHLIIKLLFSKGHCLHIEAMWND